MDNINMLINFFDGLEKLTPEEIIKTIWDFKDSGIADDLTELYIKED